MLLTLRRMLLGAAVLLGGVQAAVVQGQLQLNGTLEIDAFAELTSKAAIMRQPITARATFSFPDVGPGEYVLRVLSKKYSFQTYAISVAPLSEEVTASLYMFGVGPLPGTQLRHPLSIPSLGQTDYFDPVPSFNIITMAKGNPMILMMLFAGISMFGLPKLLSMIDPEIAEEVAQNQREMHSKLASFSNMDVAGGLSKALSGGSETGSGASTPQIAASEGGKSKKKRK